MMKLMIALMIMNVIIIVDGFRLHEYHSGSICRYLQKSNQDVSVRYSSSYNTRTQPRTNPHLLMRKHISMNSDIHGNSQLNVAISDNDKLGLMISSDSLKNSIGRQVVSLGTTCIHSNGMYIILLRIALLRLCYTVALNASHVDYTICYICCINK